MSDALPPLDEKERAHAASHALGWMAPAEREKFARRASTEAPLAAEVRQAEDLIARLSLRAPERVAPDSVLHRAKARIAGEGRRKSWLLSPWIGWAAAATVTAFWAITSSISPIRSGGGWSGTAGGRSRGKDLVREDAPTEDGSGENAAVGDEPRQEWAKGEPPKWILPGPDQRTAEGRVKPSDPVHEGPADGPTTVINQGDTFSLSQMLIVELRQPGTTADPLGTREPLFDRVADALERKPPAPADPAAVGGAALPPAGLADSPNVAAVGGGGFVDGAAGRGNAFPNAVTADGAGGAPPGKAADPTPPQQPPNAAPPQQAPPDPGQAKSDGGPLAWVMLDQATGKGSFIVSGLPPPGENESYQLWLMNPNGGQPISAGLLPSLPNGGGQVVFTVDQAAAAARDFLLTKEVAQGARQPSARVILRRQE